MVWRPQKGPWPGIEARSELPKSSLGLDGGVLGKAFAAWNSHEDLDVAFKQNTHEKPSIAVCMHNWSAEVSETGRSLGLAGHSV